MRTWGAYGLLSTSEAGPMLWINTLLLAIAVLVFFLAPWPWYYAAPLALVAEPLGRLSAPV
jgi:hypothetical protein